MHMSHRVHPGFDFLLSVVSCLSITLLEESLELLTPSVDSAEIVVRELAPSLMDSWASAA
jgi:hypothetical protein